jgi:predicted nucleic acid-binding protein
MKELSHHGAPTAVRMWLARLPTWIDVRIATSAPDVELAFLGPGEREAIQLAAEQDADLLLIDERKGRLEAKRRGLLTTGTLGVLLNGDELGLVDAAMAYRRLLLETSFRTSAALEAQFLGLVRSKS